MDFKIIFEKVIDMRKSIIIITLLSCLFLISCSKENMIKNDWEQNKVYKWGDYFNSKEHPGGEDFYLNMTLDKFPDITFEWKDYSITSTENGNKKGLISGMPIMNAYFTDLNDDGYPELCTSVYFGSGIIDMHIEVYDIKNDKSYTLCERMEYDYRLIMENDELLAKKILFVQEETDNGEIGKIVIENDILKFVGIEN